MYVDYEMRDVPVNLICPVVFAQSAEIKSFVQMALS